MSLTAARDFADLPDLSADTLEDELEAALRALAIRELQPWWVDLARPDVGVAVGRAVVPGLEQLNDVTGYTPGARAVAAIEAGAR
jgi:ribosomal protein S12 methylthiotransferase accessory factor